MTTPRPLGDRTLAVLKCFNTKASSVLEVAKAIGLERAQVQSVVTRLENGQYVKRSTRKSDGVLIFTITAAGKEALKLPRGSVAHHGGAHGRAAPSSFARSAASGGRESVMKLPSWIPLVVPVARPGADDFKKIPSKGIKT